MKIRIDVSEKIPKQYHDAVAKNCLRAFCDYNSTIGGVVVGADRIIGHIEYEFSMYFNKSNILLIFVSLRGQ